MSAAGGRARRDGRALPLFLGVAAIGGLLRAGFVLWAPDTLNGDGLYYHLLAKNMLQHQRYLNPDGSPGIQWLPGWPATLAAIYALAGPEPRIAMLVNAALGGGTAGLVALLGRRLFGVGIGLSAGLVYAVWPGNVYYASTLLTESIFTFALVVLLWTLANGAAATGRRRSGWFTASGFALGGLGMLRSEPLALAAMGLLFLFTVRRSRAEFVRHAALAGAAAALVMLPWVVRNYRTFDRLIVSSGSGGSIAWLANHPGATGTNEFWSMRAYLNEHRRSTHAATMLAASRAGWGEAWRFVREHPGEWLAIVGQKLEHTYDSDSEAVWHIRGYRDPDSARKLHWRTNRSLRRLADRYWFAVLGLAAVGLTTARRFRPETRVLLFGLLATWLAIHVVFLGGGRFHVPEQPVYALLAALGLERIAGLGRRALAARRTAAARSGADQAAGTLAAEDGAKSGDHGERAD